MAFYKSYLQLRVDPQYATLAPTEMSAYDMIRDRLNLSIKNNWRDEKWYYIRFNQEKMAALLHVTVPTVRKAIKALIKAGLLEEKREGCSRANKLYVKLLPGEDEAEAIRLALNLPHPSELDITGLQQRLYGDPAPQKDPAPYAAEAACAWYSSRDFVAYETEYESEAVYSEPMISPADSTQEVFSLVQNTHPEAHITPVTAMYGPDATQQESTPGAEGTAYSASDAASCPSEPLGKTTNQHRGFAPVPAPAVLRSATPTSLTDSRVTERFSKCDAKNLSANQTYSSQTYNTHTDPNKPYPDCRYHTGTPYKGPYPSEERIKREHFWVLQEGCIFKYGDSFWTKENGKIVPHLFGDALKNETAALLEQIGMSPDSIVASLAAVCA